ncbi:MAG: redox-sensitive bicupin YhaK (pirin superfamily) [Bacteroidia bacterium]|jgi:redox-sensitive bicupin YhaK (pirin superfamily)
MSVLKKIKTIIPAQLVNMGGHIIDQPLPNDTIEYIDPFLLIHHWRGELLGGQRQNEVGVGPHPHRGFSPVTFVYKGNVVHRDSLGNKATVDEGGTQWMFAGRGITHSERHVKQYVEEGGPLEFIQFWVNAPAELKMTAPFYKPISLEETPVISNDTSNIYVVAGDFEGVEGVAPINSPQTLLRGDIKAKGERKINLSTTHNTLIYLLDGEMSVNGKVAREKDMVVFEAGGETIQLVAKFDTRFIVLSGAPLNEPVQSYGPYVMNNQTQILEAMRDYQMGKMGVLIEDFD